MRMTFIHGRAQQGKDPAALQAEWEEAWERGLHAAGLQRPAGIEVAFPFYGDQLDAILFT